MAREWQGYGASRVAHLVDTDRPAPKRSGARTVCGRYPGRHLFPWWALSEAEMQGKPLPYPLERCPECAVAETDDSGVDRG